MSTADVKYWESENVDQHVELIRRQLNKSTRDPELRRLAIKIVNHTPDDYIRDRRTGREVPVVIAYGQVFQLPYMQPCAAKDDRCESQALWDFCVLNVRYVLDPAGYDLFATARHTLEAGGGDCDDFVILLGALHKVLGFSVAARVVATQLRHWEHVYLLVGMPKEGSRRWFPLDPTVKGAVPGWEYPRSQAVIDFPM